MPSVPDAPFQVPDSKSAHAKNFDLLGFQPGSSTFRMAALTTMLQDWTDEEPEIYHSAIDMEHWSDFA